MVCCYCCYYLMLLYSNTTMIKIDLADGAKQFRTGTRKVKNRMCFKYIIIVIALILVILAVIVIAILIGCGFPTFSRCGGGKKK
jgi:subtilase family serine protease